MASAGAINVVRGCSPTGNEASWAPVGTGLEYRTLLIGSRIRVLREAKNLSPSEIEKRSGLRRSYLSRVENHRSVPSVQTLERFARALDVPLYRLFYDGKRQPGRARLLNRESEGRALWGNSGKQAQMLAEFQRFLGRMSDSDRHLLLLAAQIMARLRRQRNSIQAGNNRDAPK